jgi:subtilisin family serine protease
MQFFLAPTDLNGQNPDPSKRPDAVGNSYTCPPSEGCQSNSLLTAMDNMRAAGIFMAVAAGNSGPACSTVADPPAIYDSGITVGATAADDSIAAFSSRGLVTVDGSNRRKPDLAAPGVGVRSSFNGSGASYVYMSGTSMAAPHVAGAVLLLWSAFPALRDQVGGTEFTFQQSALHEPASQTCGGDALGQVPNNVYGFGRIDVLAAFRFEQNFTGLFKLFLPGIMRSY